MTTSFAGYPAEQLDPDEDDGTMPDNLGELASAVVGHRIIAAEKMGRRPEQPVGWREGALLITLDNGQQVIMGDSNDCCAYTEVQEFLLHPELVDHIIIGVGTTEEYTRWHIFADLGDVLELTVGWSCGNPFYYGYGFSIDIRPVAASG